MDVMALLYSVIQYHFENFMQQKCLFAVYQWNDSLLHNSFVKTFELSVEPIGWLQLTSLPCDVDSH